jgi:hypothetical protein
VRLRPNRGFPGCLAHDVTPQQLLGSTFSLTLTEGLSMVRIDTGWKPMLCYATLVRRVFAWGFVEFAASAIQTSLYTPKS